MYMVSIVPVLYNLLELKQSWYGLEMANSLANCVSLLLFLRNWNLNVVSGQLPWMVMGRG